jgi:hypothetical protein
MVARQANIYRHLVSSTVSNLLEVLLEKYLRPNNLKVGWKSILKQEAVEWVPL